MSCWLLRGKEKRKKMHLFQLPRARCLTLLGIASSTEQMKQIHSQMIINNLVADVPTMVKLVEGYLIVNGRFYAHSALQQTFQNSLVASHAFVSSYPSLLRACARLGALHGGMQVHARAIKSGIFMFDIASATTGVHFYATCKDTGSARLLFDEMTTKTVVTWNAMMTGYCLNNFPIDALVLFKDMLRQALVTTERTAVALLTACSQLGDSALGQAAHAYVHKIVASYEDSVFCGTALVDMYSKCGCLGSATRVFNKMREKNVLTWSAMIGGMAIHSKGKEALQLLDEMDKEGHAPNVVTFTSLLSACCHGGLVDEGLYLFKVMKRRFGVEPCIHHYGCVVDLLGRAGRVEEAHEFVRRMPMEPDAVVWRALLAACRMHGREGLGEEIGKLLLKQQHQKEGDDVFEHRQHFSSCADYVALSNIYASVERWKDVLMLREEARRSHGKYNNHPGWSSFS